MEQGVAADEAVGGQDREESEAEATAAAMAATAAAAAGGGRPTTASASSSQRRRGNSGRSLSPALRLQRRTAGWWWRTASITRTRSITATTRPPSSSRPLTRPRSPPPPPSPRLAPVQYIPSICRRACCHRPRSCPTRATPRCTRGRWSGTRTQERSSCSTHSSDDSSSRAALCSSSLYGLCPYIAWLLCSQQQQRLSLSECWCGIAGRRRSPATRRRWPDACTAGTWRSHRC